MQCARAFLWLLALPYFESSVLWPQIRRFDAQIDELVIARQEEIQRICKHWSERAMPEEIASKRLKKTPLGSGSAYILYDTEESPLSIIKPFDEETFCLNNSCGFASPLRGQAYRINEHIPLYRTFQAELLASAFAKQLGLSSLTPEIRLALLTHEGFFDITDPASKCPMQKLCTIQPYLSDLIPLSALAERWIETNVSEEEILSAINQEEFEKLCLFIWLIGDADAHASNLYLQNNHLIKLDNSLTFPQKNGRLKNALAFLPHADRSLSEELRSQITQLPLEDLKQLIHFYELEDSLEAFTERVKRLQTLASQSGRSIKEIDLYLHAEDPRL